MRDEAFQCQGERPVKKSLAMITFAVTCGSGNLAFGQDRSRFFVAMPDKASAMIIGTDPAAVCAGINFIHAETGLVTVGTSGGGSNCLGNQSSVPGNCSADGSINCFVPSGGNLKAVQTGADSSLKPENIRTGIIIGGVEGKWPSAGTSTATKLTSLGVAASTLGNLPGYNGINSDITSPSSKKEYTLFGDDGKPYKFLISSVDTTVKDSTNTANYTTQSNTLFKGFTVSGAEDLTPGSIVHGKTIFGQEGTAIPRGPWIKSATLTSVFDRLATGTSLQTPVAKANIFKKAGTETYWMLLRDEANTSNPLIKNSTDANTDCGSASVSFNNSTFGNATAPWSLPSEKDVRSAQVTGGTGAGGLFATEGLISGNKFWIKTTTEGSYEVVGFSSATAVPTRSTGTASDLNLVVCVYKPSSLFAGNGTGFSAKFTVVNTQQTLPTISYTYHRANVMMSPDSNMQVAYIYTSGEVANSVSKLAVGTTALTNLCSNSSLSIPTGFSEKTWRVLDATDIEAYGPQFMSDPFIGAEISSYNSNEAFWLRSTISGSATTARYKIDFLTNALTLVPSDVGNSSQTAAAICVIKK